MIKVLLDCTPSELRKVTGDTIYYRNLLAIRHPYVKFFLLKERFTKLRKARKIWDKMLMKWRFPIPIRRSIIFAARRSLIVSAQLPDDICPDVIHSQINCPIVLGRKAIPIIWSTQGIGADEYYERFIHMNVKDVLWYYSRMLRHCTTAIVWAQSSVEILRTSNVGAPVEFVPFFIPGPAEKPDFDVPLNQAIRLLFVGSNVKLKGLEDLLEAIKILHCKGKITLSVIGRTNSDFEEYWAGFNEINFLGTRPNEEVRKLMRESDVLVHPTYADAFGCVLVEAMAGGCAIITSKMRPLDEIVPENEVGFLIEPGNAEQIAEAIDKLASNPRLLVEMKKAAFMRFKNTYSEEVVVPKLIQVYRKAMEISK